MKEASEEYGTLEGRIIHQTDAAILFWDGEKQDWIPRSVIEDVQEMSSGFIELLVDVGFLEAKGWV